MKVLFILVRLHTNVYYRISSIKENDVSVLVEKRGFSEITDDEVEVGLIERSNISKKKFVPKFSSLKRSIKDLDPDVVFIKTPKDLRFYMSILISHEYGKKIVILEQEREIDPNRRNIFFYIYNKFLKLIGVKAIIVPTRDSLGIFQKYRSVAHYIPFVYKNGIAENTPDENRIRLLSIGKFTRRKNQLFLIKAFERIYNDHNIFLTIVGQEKDKEILIELLEYIDEKHLGDVVEILKNVDPMKIGDIYRKSDIFIQPSYQEPASFSIVEAFHYGIPVICSSDCGTRCYIDDGSNGYIFRPDSEDELVECITNTIENLDKMKEDTKRIYLENHQQHMFHDKLIENEIISSAEYHQ